MYMYIFGSFWLSEWAMQRRDWMTVSGFLKKENKFNILFCTWKTRKVRESNSSVWTSLSPSKFQDANSVQVLIFSGTFNNPSVINLDFSIIISIKNTT